jgi:hypothetical protein
MRIEEALVTEAINNFIRTIFLFILATRIEKLLLSSTPIHRSVIESYDSSGYHSDLMIVSIWPRQVAAYKAAYRRVPALINYGGATSAVLVDLDGFESPYIMRDTRYSPLCSSPSRLRSLFVTRSSDMPSFNVLLVALSLGLSARAQSYTGTLETAQRSKNVAHLPNSPSHVPAVKCSKPQVRGVQPYILTSCSYHVLSAKRVRSVPTSVVRQRTRHLCARMPIVSHLLPSFFRDLRTVLRS